MEGETKTRTLTWESERLKANALEAKRMALEKVVKRKG